MTLHFYHSAALAGLWLLPAVVGLFLYASRKRRAALRAFGSASGPVGRKREAVGLCAAIALTIFALARPAWDVEKHDVEASGRDVVFLLDVSRSMLADDLHPTRLDHAKTAILDALEHMRGDRVGLVPFAGSAEIRCPLTVDYDYFRMALRETTPQSVALGGTDLANAVEKVAERLAEPERAGLLDVVLITDGDETLDAGRLPEVVRKLNAGGGRLIAIGLGSKRGSRIPLEDEQVGGRVFLRHGNREVWTRLRADALRRVVREAPGNVYVEVADAPFDLARIYDRIMENADRAATEVRRTTRYKDRFPRFLAAALAALWLAGLRPRRAKPAAWATLAILTLLPGLARAESAGTLFRLGNRALDAGDFAVAEATFSRAEEAAHDAPQISYNLGIAHYRAGNHAAAAESFARAASMADGDAALRAHACHNLGNALMKQAEDMRKEDAAAAVECCRQAALSYRAALSDRPDFADAAYNLELAQRLAAAIDRQTKREAEKRLKKENFLAYLRQKLGEFVDRQRILAESRTTGEPQRRLEKETRDLLRDLDGVMTAGESPPPKSPANPTGSHPGSAPPHPLRPCRTHLSEAVDSMARPAPSQALEALRAALLALPEPPPPSGDSSSDQNFEETEYDRADDADAAQFEDANPFGDFSGYEEVHGLPPPNRSEADVLEEELRNLQKRKKARKGGYKPVEKDW